MQKRCKWRFILEMRSPYDMYNISRMIHYRQTIWIFFSFQRFFLFCGVCRVYLYLVYIPTSRYYFLGINSQPIAKWTTKVKKKFGPFSLLDAGSNSCCLIVRLLTYLFVCLLEILCTITLFIYHLVWCDRQGISIVGTSHRRTLE